MCSNPNTIPQLTYLCIYLKIISFDFIVTAFVIRYKAKLKKLIRIRLSKFIKLLFLIFQRLIQCSIHLFNKRLSPSKRLTRYKSSLQIHNMVYIRLCMHWRLKIQPYCDRSNNLNIFLQSTSSKLSYKLLLFDTMWSWLLWIYYKKDSLIRRGLHLQFVYNKVCQLQIFHKGYSNCLRKDWDIFLLIKYFLLIINS